MNEAHTSEERVQTAIGHDMREFALLWLVFSLLDVLIKETLTMRWIVGNMLFSGAIWALGAYIEFKTRKES